MFRLVVKHCQECGKLLQLNNNRDIERKKFCSRVCTAKAVGKNVDMTMLWAKCNTPEANAKKAHKKENHPKWILDRSKVKGRLRPEKNEWRDAVFARDSFICKHCGKHGGQLEAHHKAPYSLFLKLQHDIGNGMTLCKPCHKDLHKAATELFGAINSKKHIKGAYFANCQ